MTSPSYCCLATCLLALLSARGALAQTNPTPARDTALAGGWAPKIKPELYVSRAAGEITIDGRLDDPGWEGAARVTGFTELRPDNMTRPEACTEVLVSYDEHRLYLGFIAHGDPEKVRAVLRNRDQIFSDDWVGIILDTYGEAVRAYEIFANPFGVQGDLLMSPAGEDAGFDLIYYSDGRLTEEGYVVEMAIPFSSLRFPNAPQQTWRILFARNHPRASRHLYTWAATDLDNPCLLCQLGTINGIRDVEASTHLSILPAVVGSQVGERSDSDDPTSAFDNARFDVEPSLNLRYDLTSSLAVEAAVNPDFSQVASDAAQIDVNSTFALFYPERRPFFQEGSDLFKTWIDVVYTRSINDPIAATKLTGYAGPWSLAYLGALDENTPLLLPFEERSELVEAGRSLANVLRARRTFGTNSFAGVTFTDRRLLDGGGGTLGSLDLQLQFLENYRLEAQLAVSDTREPASEDLSEQVSDTSFARGEHSATLDGERFRGSGTYLSLERDAYHWDFGLDYRAYSPAFRTHTGFVTQNDFHRLSMGQRYTFYPESVFIDRLVPGVELSRAYNFGGVRKEDRIEANLFARLTGQTNVFLSYDIGRERFHGADFGNLHAWVIDVYSQFSEPLSLGFYVVGGRAIRRADDPEAGRRLSLGVNATIQPLRRLAIEPSFDFARLTDLETGEPFFEGYIVRVRTSYQFSRELSARLITQYDHFSGRLSVEPLLTYRLNPFSVFYVGATSGYHAFDDPYGLRITGRQAFFKFQYLFRL